MIILVTWHPVPCVFALRSLVQTIRLVCVHEFSCVQSSGANQYEMFSAQHTNLEKEHVPVCRGEIEIPLEYGQPGYIPPRHETRMIVFYRWPARADMW